MSPSPIAEGFWIWKKKGPEDIAVEDGPNWIKVPGYDIAGEGDVHHIGGVPAGLAGGRASQA